MNTLFVFHCHEWTGYTDGCMLHGETHSYNTHTICIQYTIHWTSIMRTHVFPSFAKKLVSCASIHTHNIQFNIQESGIHVPDLMIQIENRLQLFFTSTRWMNELTHITRQTEQPQFWNAFNFKCAITKKIVVCGFDFRSFFYQNNKK